MIDPMSSKPLPLPLPLPRSFATAVATSSAFAFACFAFLLILHGPLCSAQALDWHSLQQYASPQVHTLNVTPFFGFWPHPPHETICGSCCCWCLCCVDDMAMLFFDHVVLRSWGRRELPPCFSAVCWPIGVASVMNLPASLHKHS